MKKYFYSIGLVGLSLIVLIVFAGAAIAERKPLFELVTQEGNAEVMRGYALQGMGAQLTSDGGRQWMERNLLSFGYKDSLDTDNYDGERNELIADYRSFMRGHQRDDSYYRDEQVIIGADADKEKSEVLVRILNRSDSKVREFKVPVKSNDSMRQRVYLNIIVQDIQLIGNRIHLLVSDYTNSGWAYTDYVVDRKSGTVVESQVIYVPEETTDVFLRSSMDVKAEFRELAASPIIMFNIKTIKTDSSGSDSLKEWRIMGYDYASGETWNLPQEGLDLIKKGLEPTLHEGKLFMYKGNYSGSTIHFMDPKTGKQAAEPLSLPAGEAGSRYIRFGDGFIYVSFRDEGVTNVIVYEEATRAVAYRGLVKKTNPKADALYSYFRLNYIGK
ncbi:hypothetical protein [Paenibacillus herberti]|uniref:Uncharacterized protein n=1 Tax=Paenibacillus herberti TaxID=1619309 RepID=A0A229P1D0_9BACL|nr:hypothetical protein [Paenibacillus herberti]OXM15699.1 hypothetical protein CGZ75_02920 [Paenibacillus herberti]